VPSAKLAAARAALTAALDASDDREVRRCIDEALQHLHALEAELAADRQATTDSGADDE
jgi:cob(I)alamin adenosyltransferase